MINEWQSFANDLERAYGADFTQELCRDLCDYQRAEEEMAFSRQRKIADANARIERSWLEGFGEHHMSVEPEAFFYWAKRLGKDCWTDPGFIAEFKRDNPEVVVKCRKRNASIIRP